MVIGIINTTFRCMNTFLMKKIVVLLLVTFFYGSLSAQSHKLLFKTSQGNFKVLLYDFTPKHQELIINAVRNGVYKESFFNRIIENFVVQGGEHDNSIAEREAYLPKDQHKRLLPEFNNRAFHKLGAIGAGRDENIEKASFLNQIYFVVGKNVSEDELNALEIKKEMKFTQSQRETYLSIGGQPRLDHDYTVFGEVYEGLEVLLAISKMPTNENDFPLQDISFEIIEIFE